MVSLSGVSSICLLAAVLLGTGCGRRQEPREAAIGEAYVSPETLHLRREIPLNSGTVATVKRGERVEILQKRRRFLRVRTAANQVGWTDQSQLLTPEVYRQIDQMARQAGRLPALGVYRTREKLNMHFEPYRWSQSFYQLQEGEKVELLERQVTERSSVPPERAPANAAPAPAAPSSASASTAPVSSTAPSEPGKAPEKPKAYDEWYFGRTLGTAGSIPNGRPGALPSVRAGWVLARMVYADIPDEVAQYAEGHQITSYFPLGEVEDGDAVKKIWLWTTTSRGTDPQDFDSFRVFNWGRRRHRYETAYIERRLTGYFPVSVTPEVKTRYGTGHGFSLVVEKDDGKRYTERYVMLGAIVRRYNEEPYVASAPPAAAAEAPAGNLAAAPGLLRRLWNRLRRR
ncbi:MAG TPA: SH3 domain-containing protein [Bryobacterales bacterium]|nr:SH3 domain-containing protein [Bryobacterales bacterium]